MYSCTLTTSSTLSCTPTVNINCDHSMDLGVVCKTHQDVIGSVINRTINQTLQTCPERNMNNDITLADEVRSCDNTGSPIAALGGLVGLLMVALPGLAIGLTVTCCVFGNAGHRNSELSEFVSIIECVVVSHMLVDKTAS